MPHDQVEVLSELDPGVWRNSSVFHSFYRVDQSIHKESREITRTNSYGANILVISNMLNNVSLSSFWKRTLEICINTNDLWQWMGTHILDYGSYENTEITRKCSQLNVSTEFVVQLVFLHEPNLFTKCFKWWQSSDFSASCYRFSVVQKRNGKRRPGWQDKHHWRCSKIRLPLGRCVVDMIQVWEKRLQ